MMGSSSTETSEEESPSNFDPKANYPFHPFHLFKVHGPIAKGTKELPTIASKSELSIEYFRGKQEKQRSVGKFI